MPIKEIKIDHNNIFDKISEYIEIGEYKKVQNLLIKSHTVNPFLMENFIWETILALKNNDLHQAYQSIVIASNLAKKNRNKKDILPLKTVILEKMGLLSYAEKSCRQAIYIDPENKKNIVHLQKILKKIKRNQQYIQQSVFIEPATKKKINNNKEKNKAPDTNTQYYAFNKETINTDKVIDIIIPVYDDYQSTRNCIESVLKSLKHNKLSYNILIINDASPQSKINNYLKKLQKNKKIELLINPYNLGFIDTVNKGFSQHKDRDIVLLNADTLVKHNCLDRLHDCAYSKNNIATVTPLSNNAELVSFPIAMKNNKLNDIHQQTEKLDQICQQVNQNQSIEIPTGVGCCMYIRRTALEEIGYLNDTELQRGYGEEVDLCLRFSAKGWENHCATHIFIAHIGGLSFKHEKRLRVIQNLKILNKKYPSYEKDYQYFLNQDDLYSHRERIEIECLKENTQAYTLIIAPNGGYQALTMRKYRFDYSTNHTQNIIYLYKDDKRNKHCFYLSEDKHMGYANLRYFYPKEHNKLIQHLNFLKITSIIDHSDNEIKDDSIKIINALNIHKNNISKIHNDSNITINKTTNTPSKKHTHAQKSPNINSAKNIQLKTNRATQTITVLILSANDQDSGYTTLLNLARYIAANKLCIQLLKVGDCIANRALMHTGCVKIFPHHCLSNDNISEFLSASGIDLSIDLNEYKNNNFDYYLVKQLLNAGIKTSLLNENLPKHWKETHYLKTHPIHYNQCGKNPQKLVSYLTDLAGHVS